MATNDNGNGDGGWSDTSTYIVLWVVSATAFLLFPFVVSAHRRKVCYHRIKERRWNVDVEPEPEPTWLRTARDRYERGRAAESDNAQNGRSTQTRLTKADEEEIRQLFLLERIGKYSKSLAPGDINVRTTDVTALSAHGPIQAGSAAALVPPCVGEAGDIENARDANVNKPNEGDPEARVTEFYQRQHSSAFVTVPAPGESLEESANNETRDVANGCAICIGEFEQGQRVTWASTHDCPHVFHEDCILKWLLAVGRKKHKRRRNHPDESTGDPVRDITQFPMLCPCCRQQYVRTEQGSESESPEPGSESESTEPGSASESNDLPGTVAESLTSPEATHGSDNV